MDATNHNEQRKAERRLVERRRLSVPVFLETRRPPERRSAARRRATS